jgi:hypothetical protein
MVARAVERISELSAYFLVTVMIFRVIFKQINLTLLGFLFVESRIAFLRDKQLTLCLGCIHC